MAWKFWIIDIEPEPVDDDAGDSPWAELEAGLAHRAEELENGGWELVTATPTVIPASVTNVGGGAKAIIHEQYKLTTVWRHLDE